MKQLLGAAAFLAALMMVGAILLAPPAATAGESTDEMPFRATLQGYTTDIEFAGPPGATSTFDGRCSVPSDWMIFFAGSGRATYLGGFTWTSSHCTQVGANPPATVTISDGELEYVAANGDVLLAEYGNSRVTVATPTLICIDDDVTFIGGSGRFVHASGSAVERGCFDPNEPSLPALADLRITSTGTITFDASDRA